MDSFYFPPILEAEKRAFGDHFVSKQFLSNNAESERLSPAVMHGVIFVISHQS